jgi:hypothetical protein
MRSLNFITGIAMLPPIDLDKHIERPLLAVALLALMAGVALLAASHPQTNRARCCCGECLSAAAEQDIADPAKAADIARVAAIKIPARSLRPSQNITPQPKLIGGFFLHVKTR